jgi:transcriptional regulator with XRE-family HTH domain
MATKNLVEKMERSALIDEDSIKANLKESLYEFTANITQMELANNSDVNLEVVKSYLKGKNNPSYVNVAKIAAALGTSPDYLCKFHEDNNDLLSCYKSLIFSAQKLNLNVCKNDEGEIVITIEKRNQVETFKKLLDDNAKDKSCRDSIPFMMYRGELVYKTEFYEFSKLVYFYGELLSLEHSENPYGFAELYNELRRIELTCDPHDVGESELREIEWNETNGKPQKHLPEEYHDLIGV